MESSRRDLFIDMAVDRFIFKNNQITLYPCSTFMTKIGVGLPKPGVRFYCVRHETWNTHLKFSEGRESNSRSHGRWRWRLKIRFPRNFSFVLKTSHVCGRAAAMQWNGEGGTHPWVHHFTPSPTPLFLSLPSSLTEPPKHPPLSSSTRSFQHLYQPEKSTIPVRFLFEKMERRTYNFDNFAKQFSTDVLTAPSVKLFCFARK